MLQISISKGSSSSSTKETPIQGCWSRSGHASPFPPDFGKLVYLNQDLPNKPSYGPVLLDVSAVSRTKGQLISKFPFAVFKSPKKVMKFL